MPREHGHERGQRVETDELRIDHRHVDRIEPQRAFQFRKPHDVVHGVHAAHSSTEGAKELVRQIRGYVHVTVRSSELGRNRAERATAVSPTTSFTGFANAATKRSCGPVKA